MEGGRGGRWGIARDDVNEGGFLCDSSEVSAFFFTGE